MLVLKIIKRFNKDKVCILENSQVGLLALKVGKDFICCRHAGNVLLDKSWDLKTNKNQKFKLKDFLGGMYIEEVRKEVQSGSFKVCDLNHLMS